MNAHLAPAGMAGHVWMKKTDFTASVLRASSRHTVTPRWTSVAAAPVSMAHAGMTSMGTNCYNPSDFTLLTHSSLIGVLILVVLLHFPVTAVTVSLGGWGRTVTWTGTTVCRVRARMLAHALTSSMASPANVAKASEVRGQQCCAIEIVTERTFTNIFLPSTIIYLPLVVPK